MGNTHNPTGELAIGARPLYLSISFIFNKKCNYEYIADDIKIDDEARPAPASTPRSLFSKKTKTGSAAISGNSKYINVLFFSNFLKKRYSSSDCNVNCLLETEREKLFDGSSDVEKPRMKSTQEILTKYKFGGVLFLF